MKGKAKEDFENYWLSYELDNTELDSMPVGQFYLLPESMKWGVIVDFFDSVGIYISIIKSKRKEFCYDLLNEFLEYIGDAEKFKSRQEARAKAIEKANEIYNNEQD